ncbi:hypothetical protein GCM10022631_24430 [Deinococcus rubellus]
MLNRDFQPGTTLATQLKTPGTVLDLARHCGAALPPTEQMTATFRTSAQAGQSQPGHSAPVLHLKQLHQPTRSPA